MTALYSVPAWLSLKPSNVEDLDVWWHIRTGQWIVQHRWVPYADWFSSYGIGKPWAAYSWLFEIFIYGLFSRLGLIGLLVFLFALVLSITATLHSLVRKFEPRVANSVALTALALFAMARLWTPRPWLFTILFFTIELNILVGVRRSRNYRALLLLPPLFALWVNLHIQFVYGLFVLGLAAFEDPINRLLRRRIPVDDEMDRSLPAGRMVAITFACLIATLVNPYHFRIYSVVLDTAGQVGLYELITELQAMQFRSLSHWLVLGLTLGAAFMLGRRREVSPFWGLLLLTGAFLSFRSSRDVWFVTIVATAILAHSRPIIERSRDQLTNGQVLLAVLATAALLGVTIRAYHISNTQLQKGIAEDFPVAAASFIEDHRLPGPLYNHFDWGGYLIWRLPNWPVSIDGRTNLHNTGRVLQTLKTWKGQGDWASDPELSAAGVVLAERDFALTQLLRLDPRFELVYEDNIAVVFVRSNPTSSVRPR